MLPNSGGNRFEAARPHCSQRPGHHMGTRRRRFKQDRGTDAREPRAHCARSVRPWLSGRREPTGALSNEYKPRSSFFFAVARWQISGATSGEPGTTRTRRSKPKFSRRSGQARCELSRDAANGKAGRQTTTNKSDSPRKRRVAFLCMFGAPRRPRSASEAVAGAAGTEVFRKSVYLGRCSGH